MPTTFLLGENNSRFLAASRKPFYQLHWLKFASCKQRKTKGPSPLTKRLEQSSPYFLPHPSPSNVSWKRQAAH